jgi:hypothetical protein
VAEYGEYAMAVVAAVLGELRTVMKSPIWCIGVGRWVVAWGVVPTHDVGRSKP